MNNTHAFPILFASVLLEQILTEENGVGIVQHKRLFNWTMIGIKYL